MALFDTRVKGAMSRCIRCNQLTPMRFMCACDLFHALCDLCAFSSSRLDCAHIPAIQPVLGYADNAR